jgi:2-oxoglutarate dehydrogenase E2 component (dihydrolipoamide succinyltransferase)
MAIQIKVPAVGESITEVTIANWLKKDGDTVQLDEVIAELESDKATFELTAPSAGVLKIVKPQGSTVPIGELICEVEPSTQAVAPPLNRPIQNLLRQHRLKLQAVSRK